MAIAVPVLSGKSLGHARRLARLCAVVSGLAAHVEASLPRALPDWAALKAAYRFFANPAVTPDAIIATARPDCLARMVSAGTVLLLQDTTTISIAHPATRELGPVGTGEGQGFLVHSALAADSAGVALGLAAQHSWCRDPDGPHRASRRQRPTGEKESQRWAAVEAASRAGLDAAVTTITVADREADLFDLFAAARPANAYLLIRAAQTERVVDDDGGRLAATVAAVRPAGAYRVELPAMPSRAVRTAICTVRTTPVQLHQPRNRPAGTPRQAPVPLTAVLVTEQDPPDGVTPLHWLLLTSWPVTTFVDACQVVYWYRCRWLIERYHFVLKSGCRVEALQLQTATRLEVAVAVYGLVALQVLWLTYLAREQPETPCTVAFSIVEWQTLMCVSTQTATPPATPPSLREAARRVAMLGGFLGRKGDGEPGPLTIWRGLARLADMVAARRLFQPDAAVT